MNLDAVITTGPGQPLSDNYCQTGSRLTCTQQPPQDLVDLCAAVTTGKVNLFTTIAAWFIVDEPGCSNYHRTWSTTF